jgi:putative heme degradation protein
LARLLLAAKIHLRIFGDGWQGIDEFKPHAHGRVQSREQLYDIAGSSAALVHVWPTKLSHPLEAMGAALVRANQEGRAFVEQARRALDGHAPKSQFSLEPLGPQLLRHILMLNRGDVR